MCLYNFFVLLFAIGWYTSLCVYVVRALPTSTWTHSFWLGICMFSFGRFTPFLCYFLCRWKNFVVFVCCSVSFIQLIFELSVGHICVFRFTLLSADIVAPNTDTPYTVYLNKLYASECVRFEYVVHWSNIHKWNIFCITPQMTHETHCIPIRQYNAQHRKFYTQFLANNKMFLFMFSVPVWLFPYLHNVWMHMLASTPSPITYVYTAERTKYVLDTKKHHQTAHLDTNTVPNMNMNPVRWV